MTPTDVLTQNQWQIDTVHSELAFRVKHLMITNVKGTFGSFASTIVTDEHDFMNAQVEVIIQAASITTGEEGRDKHLRGADFFDVEAFPELRFVSTNHEKIDEDTYTLHGDLTMKDITKPVELHVEIGGFAKDPWGNEKAGLSVTGKLNRKDWGLNWNGVLETGGVLLSDEIRINAEIQLVKKQPQQ